MPKSKKFNKEIRVGVDEDLHRDVMALSERRNEPAAEIIRDLLRRELSEDAALQSMDIVKGEIRKAVKEQLKPFENRMAAMSSKGTISSATASYMMQYMLRDVAKVDPRPIWDESRKKAVNYLKNE